MASDLCTIGLTLENITKRTIDNYSFWNFYADAYTLNQDVFVHSIKSENGKISKNFTIFTNYGYPLKIKFKDEITYGYYGFPDSYFSIFVNGNQIFRVLNEHHSDKVSTSYSFDRFLSIIPYIFLEIDIICGGDDPDIQYTIEAMLSQMLCNICGVAFNAGYITNNAIGIDGYKRFVRERDYTDHEFNVIKMEEKDSMAMHQFIVTFKPNG
ncbi:hypothetical protein ABK040_000762 [Willaertia magna]